MVIAFVALMPFSDPSVLSPLDWTMLAALGAGQIGLGMILFTAGARLIAAAQAGLITLLEVVLGPLWMWLIYREQPDGLTLVGGAVILSAVLVHAVADLRPATLTARSDPL
jgi:drug/metabolite transporter (DMT)-like permease